MRPASPTAPVISCDRLISGQRGGSLEVDEPLMLLTILDVERHFQRRRLACGHQDSLRMLDHVLDSLNIRIGGLETHDERVVAIVVGPLGPSRRMTRLLFTRSHRLARARSWPSTDAE
jgi:hypothetical protein